MAAPFQSYNIDVVLDPAIPAYASMSMTKGAIGESRPRKLGFENIEQLLPFSGIRDVVHRSNSAKTGELVGRTAGDGFIPRTFGFESGLERATAINALIHPNTHDLKCQPRHVLFDQQIGKLKSNYLDFLLTLKTGQQTYLYVKNDVTLAREEQALICEQIRLQLPEDRGFAVISEATFPPQFRGNNERIFLAKKHPDPEADARLEEVLDDIIDAPKFTIEELVVRGTDSPAKSEQGRIFDAVLRAIGDQRLVADRRRLIDYSTVVGRLV
jgi:hypothetical protein